MSLISFGFRPVVVDISGNWWVDSFEPYTLNSEVESDTWDSGSEEKITTVYYSEPWSGSQNDTPQWYGLEYYTLYDGESELSGSDEGYFWKTDWDTAENFVPSWFGLDYFYNYDTGSSLDGLNKGSLWSNSWVSYTNYVPEWYGQENYDSYDTGSSLLGLNGGLYFSSAWVGGDIYLTYYSSTGNEVDLRASSFSGYSVATSSLLVIPSYEDNNALAVLVIMRRSALTTDMSSWTLVEEQQNSTTQAAIDQWTSIYSRPLNQLVTGSYLQIEQSSSVRFALSLVVLDSISGNPILVQGTAKGQYGAAANPGLHPIQSLVSLGNGRLGMVASSCAYHSTTSDTQYLADDPWTQTTTYILQDNRLCVATLPLNNGDNVTDSVSSISHSAANHDGSEISVIFYTT